ncbi:MAG TPA: hypothetical protein VLZ83_10075 [Edaphocola sp.]|nr:hypothetical protein [Edaphocola sp.]
MTESLKKWEDLIERIQSIPELNTTGLRPAQIFAIYNLGHFFKKNRPQAIFQMAMDAGKTN